jgi:uncharacterized protein YeaO (DUF488 family)
MGVFSLINIKRVYDPIEQEDGRRILVDRFFPRGIKKEALSLDGWLKDIAPSRELCRWFGYLPERFPEFAARYKQELAGKPELCRSLLEAVENGAVTLLYAARSREFNNAVVLKECLEEIKFPEPPGKSSDGVSSV